MGRWQSSRRERVFLLIKRMSRHEKRYFSQTKKGDPRASHYYRLFQVLNAADEFDWEELKREFAGQNLSSLQKQLYEQLLASIRQFHYNNYDSLRMQAMIADSRYLKERGMYFEARERLQEAEHLARELHSLPHLLEINLLERELNRLDPPADYSQTLKEHLQKGNDLMNHWEQEWLVFEAYDWAYLLQRRGAVPGDLHTDPLYLKVRSLLEQVRDVERLPALAQRKYWTTQYLQHLAGGDYPAAIEAQLKTLSWWDTHPRLKKEFYAYYISDLSNLMGLYLLTGTPEKVEPLLQTPPSLPEQDKHVQELWLTTRHLYLLSYFILTEQLDKALEHTKEVDPTGDSYYNDPKAWISIFANVVIVHFLKEKFREMKNWNRKLIELAAGSPRSDVRLLMHFLELLANLEMEDQDLALSFQQIRKNLRTKFNFPGGAPYFELVKDLSRIAKAPPFGKRKELMQNFQLKLQQFAANGWSNDLVVKYLSMWLESRLTRTPIARLYKKYH